MPSAAFNLTDTQGNTTTVTAPFTVTAAADLHEFADFAAPNTSGIYLATGALLGNGPSVTTYRMKTLTSTKKAYADGLVSGDTNQLELVRVGGMDSSHVAAAPEVGNLTLQGTDQGHQYNGLQLAYSTGAYVHDLVANGIPGSSSSPPGETFAIELWHANGARLTNVTIDGRRTSDTAAVGATLLQLSTVNGLTATNVSMTHAQYGFGVALWRSTGVQTFTGCDLRFNRKAINIEQANGGTVNFNSCTFGAGATTVNYVAQVTSINTSTVVNFRDPVVDSWPLRVNCYGPSANNGTNVQKDSDIHMFINGVDVSSDTSKLVITHV